MSTYPRDCALSRAFGKGEVGGTFTARGLIFVVLSFEAKPFANWTAAARVLLLDDELDVGKVIPPGTVMEIGDWTETWHEALQIASPGK